MLFQDITNAFTSLLYACVPWSEKKEKNTYTFAKVIYMLNSKSSFFTS